MVIYAKRLIRLLLMYAWPVTLTEQLVLLTHLHRAAESVDGAPPTSQMSAAHIPYCDPIKALCYRTICYSMLRRICVTTPFSFILMNNGHRAGAHRPLGQVGLGLVNEVACAKRRGLPGDLRPHHQVELDIWYHQEW